MYALASSQKGQALRPPIFQIRQGGRGAWLGLAWLDLAWLGLAWLGLGREKGHAG